MPLPLLLLAACTPDPDAGLGAAPPTVYLASPADGSTWRSVAPIPLTGMVVDDGEAPPGLVVEVWADDELRLRLSPTERGALTAELALPVGEHALTVTATDPEGHVGSRSVRVEVVEEFVLAAPSFTLTPEAPVTGDTLRAELDGAIASLTYVWTWTRDGARYDTTAPVIPAAEVWEGQAWQVAVYATDGVEFSPTTLAATTVANAPPTVPAPHVTPATPRVTDALTCEHGEVADLDDPELTVVTRWAIDGVGVDPPEEVLPAGVAPRGASVTCAVEATEPGGRVTTATSDPVVVQNSRPIVASASLSPAAFTELDTVTCVPGAVTDADGDAVTLSYRWIVDGIEAGRTETLDGAGFDRGDAVSCEVAGDDGFGAGPAAVSEVVEVGDSPPSAPGVAFVSAVVVPGRPASCTVVAPSLDPDGDRVRYLWSWTVDGAPSAETTDTLATDALSPGALVTCTAVATDNELTGPPGSATLALLAPTEGDVPLADAPLVLAASGAATSFGQELASPGDVDGDGIVDLGVGAAGAVYLYDGSVLTGAGLLSPADALRTLTGADLGAAGTVGTPGDLDGDGLADLLLGEPLADLDAGGDAGRLWIVTAGEGAVGDVATGWLDGDDGSRLGARSGAADLDGDGVLDLVVTAPGDGRGGRDAGAVGIWLTAAGLPSGTLADADALLLGAPDDTLGAALALPADLDGDGLADLLLGAPGADLLASGGGLAALIPAPAALAGGLATDAATLLLAGDSARDAWGAALLAPGDLDGDGGGDLVVAAPDAAGGDGSVCVTSGLATGVVPLGDTSACITGATGAAAGTALAALDFDGDALLDLLVGAPGDATASVWTGRTGWPGDPALTFLGTGDRAGAALTTGLPADADGYGTLAVGAPGTAGGGTVYVTSGP